MTHPRPLDEVNAELEAKYGDGWTEFDVTEDEAREWLDACYVHYETECEQRETYGGHDADEDEWCYDKPFEILRRIEYDDTDYDFAQKPLYIVRIEDDEFAAYPDDLFYLMG